VKQPSLDPQIQNLAWIDQVLRVEQPFKRVSLEFRHGQASDVIVNTPNRRVYFGQQHPLVVVAGPCSVENEEMIIETARRVKATGQKFLRGGISPDIAYAFQGHGRECLVTSGGKTGLGIITE